MARWVPLLLLLVLILRARLQAREGDAYVYRIDASAEFERLSIAGRFLPGVARSTKFLAPARDDGGLLPTLFQNVNLYPYHQEFLRAEFPDRFPGIAGDEYLRLVERRQTRSYFAGVIYLFEDAGAPGFGFDVFTQSNNADELPLLEEVRWIHRHLTAAFSVGPLAYSPQSGEAIRNAQGWTDADFPIHFAFGGGLPEYIAYTRAESYGRVKVLSAEEFARENAQGLFGWQDILVLDEAPADIEGVIAGVITGEVQGELGHLAIRTARRGTPNAYAKGPAAAFAPYQGKLVKLSVESTAYRVQEAVLEEAEAWWSAHRPRLPDLPPVDASYRRLDAVWEVPLDGSVDLLTRYGGKGSNFARLYSLLADENRVPGFLIPFSYYVDFLETNRAPSPFDRSRQVSFAQYIDELLADPGFRGDSARRFQELAKLRDLIEEDGVVDAAAERSIALRVVAVFGTGEKKARFRSSSNVEDLLEFNGAGLYDSTSACAADDLDSGSAGPCRCDPSEAKERGVARALKKVWASLWNFRAFEEREYYQVPHRSARMAVLVSEAFPDEAANGVAFTGNPSNRFDRAYLVNVQLGDASVVSPEPGVESEKDLLYLDGDAVGRVVRARGSSLVVPGRTVLSEGQL